MMGAANPMLFRPSVNDVRRCKHIDVRSHFISEKYNDGTIKLKYCPTNKQLADLPTKPLNYIKLEEFRDNSLCII